MLELLLRRGVVNEPSAYGNWLFRTSVGCTPQSEESRAGGTPPTSQASKSTSVTLISPYLSHTSSVTWEDIQPEDLMASMSTIARLIADLLSRLSPTKIFLQEKAGNYNESTSSSSSTVVGDIRNSLLPSITEVTRAISKTSCIFMKQSPSERTQQDLLHKLLSVGKQSLLEVSTPIISAACHLVNASTSEDFQSSPYRDVLLEMLQCNISSDGKSADEQMLWKLLMIINSFSDRLFLHRLLSDFAYTSTTAENNSAIVKVLLHMLTSDAANVHGADGGLAVEASTVTVRHSQLLSKEVLRWLLLE